MFAQWADRKAFTASSNMFAIMPTTSIHFRYHEFNATVLIKDHPEYVDWLILKNVCYSANLLQAVITAFFDGRNFCAQYFAQSTTLPYQKDLFVFEWFDATNVLNSTQLITLHTQRQERIASSNVSDIAVHEFRTRFYKYSFDQLQDLLLTIQP